MDRRIKNSAAQERGPARDLSLRTSQDAKPPLTPATGAGGLSKRAQGRWWHEPAFPYERPALSPADALQAERVKTRLEDAITLRKSPDVRRAALHLLWALDGWGDRSAEGKIRVSRAYVVIGTGLTHAPCRAAYERVRAALGVQAGSVSGGWWALSPGAREAVWQVVQAALAQDEVSEPQNDAPTIEHLFPVAVKPGRRRGLTRCGCEGHRRGDQRPSLLYDLDFQRVTCLATRRSWRTREHDGSLWAAVVRIPRYAKGEGSGCGDPVEHELLDTAQTRDNQGAATPCPTPSTSLQTDPNAGSPGPWPSTPGLLTAKLTSRYASRALSWGSGASTSRRAGLHRWHTRRWSGQAGERQAYAESAEQGRDPQSWGRSLPDRLVGLGYWRPDSEELCTTRDGRGFYRPVGLKERGIGHVLFDLDKTTHVLPRSATQDTLDRITAAVMACPLFAGVSTVVRTSSRGLQVTATLRRFRWDPRGFYQSRAVQAALLAVGQTLAAVIGGATVDRSAWAPSRLARLPGWRVKDGIPELATLWAASPDPIRLVGGPATTPAMPTQAPAHGRIAV